MRNDQDQDHQDHSNNHQDERARQYAIDTITARFVAAYRAGQAPRIEAYIARYPEYAADLFRFALYFYTIGYEWYLTDDGDGDGGNGA